MENKTQNITHLQHLANLFAKSWRDNPSLSSHPLQTCPERMREIVDSWLFHTIPCRGELWVLKCDPAALTLTMSVSVQSEAQHVICDLIIEHLWRQKRPIELTQTMVLRKDENRKKAASFDCFFITSQTSVTCTGNVSLRWNTWKHSREILRNNYAFIIFFFFCTKLPLFAISSSHLLLSLSWLLSPFTPSRKQFSPPRKLRVALRCAEDESVLFNTHHWRL